MRAIRPYRLHAHASACSPNCSTRIGLQTLALVAGGVACVLCQFEFDFGSKRCQWPVSLARGVTRLSRLDQERRGLRSTDLCEPVDRSDRWLWTGDRTAALEGTVKPNLYRGRIELVTSP
jgi:hypothetical protein